MMGETLRPDATPPASKALGKMQELVRARQAALADRTAMQNRMGESTCDAVTRLHQLDSIFAIFGSVLGSKPLYFRVGQVENRL
jgi:hypothetical protein